MSNDEWNNFVPKLTSKNLCPLYTVKCLRLLKPPRGKTEVIQMRYCIKRKHWMKNNKGWSVTIMDQELKKYVMQFYGMKAIEEAEQWLANHN